MKQVIDGILYDTDKMEYIQRRIFDARLYKAKNGKWFTRVSFGPIDDLYEMGIEQAKSELKNYPEIYAKYFELKEDAPQ